MLKNDKSIGFHISLSDYLLIFIFIVLSLAIFLKSYYNTDGYLSPDSTNYLRLAQNIIEGNGFEVGAYYHIDKSREYFAIWPVGYPVLIFFTAKITGLSVFWASKLLNILIIGLILITFRILFKEKSWIYALILFMASFQHIFTFTWSEAPFILFLFWFAIALFYFITKSEIHPKLNIAIAFLSLSLFLLRYIGFFSFLVLGLMGVIFLFINKRKAFILIGISLVNILLAELYLYNNYIKTDFLTGAKRVWATESSLEKISMISKGIIQEFLIPFTDLTLKTSFFLLFEILILFILIHFTDKKKILSKIKTNENSFKFILLFLFIGISYWISLIFLRWRFYFDDLDYRLLGPGTFIFWIIIIYVLLNYTSKKVRKIFIISLILLSLVSFTYNTLYILHLDVSKNKPYNSNIARLTKKYKTLPKASAVIFGNKHIIYIRTDIIDVQPYHFKDSIKLNDLIKKLNKFNNIYMEIPKDKRTIDDIKQLDPSVFSFIEQNKKREIVKIK